MRSFCPWQYVEYVETCLKDVVFDIDVRQQTLTILLKPTNIKFDMEIKNRIMTILFCLNQHISTCYDIHDVTCY